MYDFRRDCLGIGMPDIPGCPATSGGYIAQYQAVYDAFASPPPSSVAAAQNTMVTSLVNDGIWAKLDVFYVFANYDSSDALINWINPGSNTATNNGPCGFISYRGFVGAGGGDYIDTNYNPTTHGTNYTQNSMSTQCYVRIHSVDNFPYGTTDGIFLRLLNASSIIQYAGNSGSANNHTPVTALEGLYGVNRANATQHRLYKNGSQLNQTSRASVMPNLDIFVFAQDNGVAPAVNYFQGEISMFCAGGDLDTTEMGNFATTFETYMDSNGTGIIP